MGKGNPHLFTKEEAIKYIKDKYGGLVRYLARHEEERDDSTPIANNLAYIQEHFGSMDNFLKGFQDDASIINKALGEEDGGDDNDSFMLASTSAGGDDIYRRKGGNNNNNDDDDNDEEVNESTKVEKQISFYSLHNK